MGCIYGIPMIYGNNEFFFFNHTGERRCRPGQRPGFKRTYR